MFKYAVVERSKIIGTDVSENVKYKIELDLWFFTINILYKSITI